MPVAVASDKRFRRAHVAPSRKRTWKAAWPKLARRIVACALFGYALYYGASRALSAEALTVTHITVAGNTRMSRGEVLALLEGLRGNSMVTADLEEWREKLLGLPWVADAALRRVLPGTVAVSVIERQPMAIGRIGASLYLIDHRGTVIDEFGPNYAEFDLPVVDGLASAPRSGPSIVDEGRAALVARLLSDLQRRPDLASRISQIDVADVRDAAVILKGDTAVLRVGDERFVDRLQSYLDLTPALRDRIAEIDYVDLRFDERVYVRPRAGQKTPKGK